MAIVATLRQTLGDALTPYQYLITRYFIDVGLIQVMVSLSGIALISYLGDEALSWFLMSWMLLITIGLYFPYYLSRRTRINAPWSLTPVVVTIGTLVIYINLALSLTAMTQVSLRSAVVIFLMWAFFSMVFIFLTFIGTFMKIGNLEP
jgi:hypothetical protein